MIPFGLCFHCITLIEKKILWKFCSYNGVFFVIHSYFSHNSKCFSFLLIFDINLLFFLFRKIFNFQKSWTGKSPAFESNCWEWFCDMDCSHLEIQNCIVANFSKFLSVRFALRLVSAEGPPWLALRGQKIFWKFKPLEAWKTVSSLKNLKISESY